MIAAIVSTWNGERFLDQALESILGQTRPPDEVVVVDDGSTDGTVAVASRYPVRVLRQRNQGQGAALNAGVAATRADLIAFLDHDDVWLPDKLERQVGALVAGVDLVYGHTEEFHEPDAPPVVLRPGALPAPLPSALLLRRTAFDRLTGFDTARGVAAVADFYVRARESGLGIVMLPEVVFRRRVHGRNTGLVMRDPAAYLAMVRASLRRRGPP